MNASRLGHASEPAPVVAHAAAGGGGEYLAPDKLAEAVAKIC